MTDPVDSGGYTGSDVEPQGQGGGGHPAWQEVFDLVPQEFHEKLRPTLEKWDKGVQEGFNKVHQQYEPWKPIFDAGIDPDTAQFALNLLNSINDNPRQIWEALGSYYKLTDENQGSNNGQGQEEPQEPEDPYSPRLATLERQNEIMAAHLVKQQEQAMEAQAEQELDQELAGLRTKYKSQGEFSEPYVLALMMNGHTAEEAVQQYYQFRDVELKRYVPKPLIMGAGGSVPNMDADVRKLDDSQTKNLVVQMLQAAAAQKNQ